VGAIIVYDAECRFCRRCMQLILAWDRRRQLRGLPLQDPQADILLAPIPAAERQLSWHLVTADGRIKSAGRAIAPALRLLPGGTLPAAVCAAFPRATDRAYRFVAAHRGRLGRLIGPPASP
jgi:predicted DCC family thiol-disulfide oxidoreductase YuxK